jgi:RNA polymerase sigma-70 factor (ECF subfamily)
VTVGGAESDEEIAAVAKHGDRSAFDALVNRHKAAIYRFVRRYIGHSDDAYDVLQDCFIASWQALSRYDPARPFLPWLRVIALNKCRDFARRQKVRRLFLKAFALETVERQKMSSFDSGQNDPKDDRLSRLDEAISRLDAFYKEPLLLTTVSGLSHIEAAHLLKTTPKAIEMRIYRARRKLLEDIEGNKAEG